MYLCMYVCMYVCMCMFIYLYICMYVCISVCILDCWPYQIGTDIEQTCQWKRRLLKTFQHTSIALEISFPGMLQAVPEKMRLKMVITKQDEILESRRSGLFSNEPCAKKPVMTIEYFVWHSNDHFESHLLGNGL